jgi:diguanylate cyclase (GGDEF)-like protein
LEDIVPHQLQRHSRILLPALAVVLVALAASSVTGAARTRSAAEAAHDASDIFAAFADVGSAEATVAALAGKYQAEGYVLRAPFDTAVRDAADALRQVQVVGEDPHDLVDIRQGHVAYLTAVGSMFTAVDAGRAQRAEWLEQHRVVPAFGAVQTLIRTEAGDHHRFAQATLRRLGSTERSVFWGTLGIFGVGLALLMVLLRMLSRHLRRVGWLAAHDPLTGLPNRLQYQERVESALSRAREGDVVEVILLDLDRFKEVNDTLGHDVGDALLNLIGPRLRTILHDDDLISRLGGDEFAILLPARRATSDDMTALAAERLTAALREPFTVGEVRLQIEASIGIARSASGAYDALTLIRHADTAMYAAKASGADFVIYHPSSDDNTGRGLKLLAQMRQAIADDQLQLHYQPKIRLSDGSVSGVEALVRWQHPTEGLLNPSDFVPLAESSGLIHDLTLEVIAQAASQARSWHLAGYQLPVAVNVSARCLLKPTLPDAVREVLRREDIPGELLTLELTETAAMIDAKKAADTLRRLANLGVHLSIDDFGTGHTSMTYLSDLPIDELKIDLSYVQRMLTDPKADAVVRTCIDLAARLNLRLVAEGVDTVATYLALAERGCDQVQGYLIARPMPANELETFLHQYTPPAPARQAAHTT